MERIEWKSWLQEFNTGGDKEGQAQQGPTWAKTWDWEPYTLPDVQKHLCKEELPGMWPNELGQRPQEVVCSSFNALMY